MRHIQITEVGLRDGLQSEPLLFPLEKKIEIANLLVSAGVRQLEATSFVSPKAVPQLADAEKLIAGIDRVDGLVLEALVPNKRGAERAALTGLDVWVPFVSASESHSQMNSNVSIQNAIERVADLPELADKAGATVYGAIACAFDCPFEGRTSHEKVLHVANAYRDLGIKTIKLGDTIGTASPARVKELIRYMKEQLPDTEFILHLHDTRGLGLANVMAGIEAGIARFESSIGGMGGCPFAPGATGNISTEDLVQLLELENYETNIDLAELVDVGWQMERYLGRELPSHMLRTTPVGTRHEIEQALRAQG